MLQLAGDELPLLFGSPSGRDVNMRADELDRLAQLVPLDFSFSQNPSHFAIGRPHDAILGLILGISSKHASLEMTNNAAAVVGVDASNPSLVAFVLGLRRKPVDR